MKPDAPTPPTAVQEPPAAAANGQQQALGQTAPQTSELPATRPAGAAGSLQMGMAPKSIEEGWRLAQILAKSTLVPKNFRDQPGDVLVAIQLGLEIGLAPMQALQSIAVVNGRPSVWGDGFIALIMAAPAYRDHEEYFEVDGQRCDGITLDDLKKDSTCAVCTFWRRDKQLPITARFSVGQAKKANLLGKEGPWQTYPDRMLKMRARGFAGRDAFPDVLRGIKTAEEAMDTPQDELPPIAEPIQPRRASEARPAAVQSPVIEGHVVQPAAVGTNATAATATAADPASETQSPSLQSDVRETRGLKVTRTCFVRPKAGEPYYEISTKAVTGSDFTFLTRDERVYKEAESFEGTEYLTTIRWTSAKHSEKGAVSIAQAVVIDETTPRATTPASTRDGLFA